MDKDTTLFALAAVVLAAWIASGTTLVVILRRVRAGIPVVPERPHRPVPWRGVDVLVTLGIMVAAHAIAGVAVGESSDLGLRLRANIGASLGGAVVTAFMLRGFGATLGDLGLWPIRWAADLRLALAGLAIVVAPLLAVSAMLNTLKPYRHPIIDYLAQHDSPDAIRLVILAAIIVAPITEEFLFRRVLQGWLEKMEPTLGPGSAIALASLAFAVAHADHGLAWLPLFGLGAVLGLTARQTGSIVPAILLHALFNSVSVGLLMLQLSGLVPSG